MSKLPPEYLDDVHKMDAAARAWMKAHPFAEPRFNMHDFEREMKARANLPEDEKVMIAAPLDEHVIKRIALNEDGKQLLRAMSAATDHRASYNQAKVLIDLQVEALVERNQGQLTEPGDWRCPCCSTMLDGFSDLSLEGHRPEPGSLSVCAYCFARLCIKEGGYEALADADFARLPVAARKALDQAGDVVRKMAADRARKS